MRSPEFLAGVSWVRQGLGEFDSLGSARRWLSGYLKGKGVELPPVPKRRTKELRKRTSAGSPVPRPRPTTVVRELWLDLAERGLKTSQIARLFGRSAQLVGRGIQQARARRAAAERLGI